MTQKQFEDIAEGRISVALDYEGDLKTAAINGFLLGFDYFINELVGDLVTAEEFRKLYNTTRDKLVTGLYSDFKDKILNDNKSSTQMLVEVFELLDDPLAKAFDAGSGVIFALLDIISKVEDDVVEDDTTKEDKVV